MYAWKVLIRFKGVRIFSDLPNEQPLGQNPLTHLQPNIVHLGKNVHINGRPLTGLWNKKYAYKLIYISSNQL